MTNEELITKLKNKDAARAFGICSLEEQTVYKEAGEGNCLFFSSTGEWIELTTWKDDFTKNGTYVIKPDWEPEFDTRPVTINEFGMCRIEISSESDDWNIMDAAAHKDFDAYFYYLPGASREYISPQYVATAMFKGNKVFGSFRRS